MDIDHAPIKDGIKLAAAAAAAAVIVGSMVLLGWAFDIAVLKSILPGWVSMKPNAAVGFILAGIALWLTIRPEHSGRSFSYGNRTAYPLRVHSAFPTPHSAIFLARLCGLLVGLIGLLTLGEHIFGWNPGIDQWLFSEPVGTVGTSAPGRMAPETTLCFVLLSVALWINSASRKTYWSILASVNLGLLVMTLALAAMLSYAMPGLGPNGWFGLTIMALHTSLLFALLGVAVIANSWQQDVLQWSLGRNITVAFAGGMALLVFIGLNTSRSQFWLNETNRKIAYSEEVLGNIVGLHTELVEAQAHTRGYIITSDDWFLTAYVADMSAYHGEMDALRLLIAGNPHQQQQLALIETKADLLRRWSQQFIDAQHIGKGNAARNKMDAHAGDLLDNIRSTFEQIENEHQQLIKRLKQEAASVTRFAYISIASGTLASLLIFLTVIFRLNFAVNERKQVEMRLRESEEKFKAIFDNATDGIMLADMDDKKVLFGNATASRMLGYAPEEIGKLHVMDIHPENELPYVISEFERQARGEKVVAENMPIMRKDGSIFYAEITTAHIKLNGKTYLAGFFRDITERKQDEEALRISALKHQLLFESSRDALMMLAPPSWKFTGANLATLQLFGAASVAEFTALGPWNISPELQPDGRPSSEKAPEMIATAMREGAHFFEWEHQRLDGQPFATDVLLTRMEVGEDVFLQATVRDITERKQAEEKIHKLNEELEAKVQERTKQLREAQEELVRKEKLAVLGQVAGSVGHELRNPLGVMNNAVYFLQTVLADADSSVKEYLNIIKDEIAGSERIVSDLLDAVRTQPPRPAVVEVAELVGQTLRKCNVPPSVSVQLEIPATLSALRVDLQQINQVFRNLISNGVEAMPKGGTLKISAIENKQDGTIAVSVRDSGSGMTPEHLGRLFQPLFTTKARGIGLGLVVVKNLTEANGGTVEVQSEVGKGALFTVTLPAADETGVSI